MKTNIALALALAAATSFAAAPKTYQVTGPVLAIKDGIITVQKGSEKWEIAQDAAAVKGGELKVGSKVTIEYTMSAKTIEVKDAKTASKPEKKPAKK
ncbi:MAG: hypothetical protein RL318_247 [Fibrobacterota bacterium]|jgi:hypothetical protein